MAEKIVDKKIRVWDLPVRLFHWTLVILLVVSYFTGRAGGDWMKLHFWSGYAILTLLLFRIAWGFVGSTTARFSDFVKGPVACLAYLRDLLLGRRTYDVGHNPVGGTMVRAAALRRAGAGRRPACSRPTPTSAPSTARSPTWSPTSGSTASRTSTSFWVNVLLILVGLHVLAAIVYLVWKRQNLIGAMFTGHKPLDDVVAAGQARAGAHLRLGPAGDVAADRRRGHRLLHRPAGRLKSGADGRPVLLAGVGPPLG